MLSINEPTKFYVYVWSDPKNGVPIYVGKGQGNRCWVYIETNRKNNNRKTANTLKKRFREGLVCLPSIRYVASEAEAFELEELLIKTIGREDLGTGTLFNLTDGGEGLGTNRAKYSPTEEHRRRISEANSGRVIEGVALENIQRAARKRVFSEEALARIGAPRDRSGMKGKRHTPEALEKMSVAKRGRTPWNKGRKVEASDANV